MIRSVRMSIFGAWFIGCLLTAPALSAQLLAHQATPNHGLAKPQPGTVSLRDALMQLKKQFSVAILFEEKLLEGFNVSTRETSFQSNQR